MVGRSPASSARRSRSRARYIGSSPAATAQRRGLADHGQRLGRRAEEPRQIDEVTDLARRRPGDRGELPPHRLQGVGVLVGHGDALARDERAEVPPVEPDGALVGLAGAGAIALAILEDMPLLDEQIGALGVVAGEADLGVDELDEVGPQATAIEHAPDGPQVGTEGWIRLQRAAEELDRAGLVAEAPFDDLAGLVRDERRGGLVDLDLAVDLGAQLGGPPFPVAGAGLGERLVDHGRRARWNLRGLDDLLHVLHVDRSLELLDLLHLVGLDQLERPGDLHPSGRIGDRLAWRLDRRGGRGGDQLGGQARHERLGGRARLRRWRLELEPGRLEIGVGHDDRAQLGGVEPHIPVVHAGGLEQRLGDHDGLQLGRIQANDVVPRQVRIRHHGLQLGGAEARDRSLAGERFLHHVRLRLGRIRTDDLLVPVVPLDE